MPPAITDKWTPATPIRKHDNIIACEQFRHLKPFKPSFDEDKHTYINWLLAWEYGRLWLEEQRRWSYKNFVEVVANKSKKDFVKKNKTIALKKKQKS